MTQKQAQSLNDTSFLPKEIQEMKIDMDQVYINPNPSYVEQYRFLAYVLVPDQGKCILDIAVYPFEEYWLGDPDPEDIAEYGVDEKVYTIAELGYTEAQWQEHFGEIEWEYANL